MKKHSITTTTFCFYASLMLAIGCQKAPNNDFKTTLPHDAQGAVAEKLTARSASVCSDDFLKMAQDLKKMQHQATAMHDKITRQKKDNSLIQDYSQLAKQQVTKCTELLQQMDDEKITSCLKSKDDKSPENTIFRTTLDSTCNSVKTWEKTINQDKEPTVTTPLKATRIQFTHQGMKLIQVQNSNEFHYLSRQQVLSGQDQFKLDVTAGHTACVFSTQSKNATDTIENTAYKFVIETKSLSSDFGFDLPGDATESTFQDQNGAIISMQCLNKTVSSEANLLQNLIKLFGHHAKVETVSKSDPFLNLDVTPAPAASPTIINSKTHDSIEKEKALEQTIQKARETLDSVVKETLETTKKTALETVNESIIEAQKASTAIITQSIADAKTAAQEVIKESLDEAKGTAEIVVKNSIQEAQIATREVVKESIQQAQAAANDTVDKSIAKVKTATQETVTETVKSLNPIPWIAEKSAAAYDGIKNFFTSSDEKSIETKAIVENKK